MTVTQLQPSSPATTQQPGKPVTRWAKSMIRTLQHWNKVLAGI
jgi:hypothetical protein